MTYRELIKACRNNYLDNCIRNVFVVADTLEAKKELSKNNPENEHGYTPITSGAGFRLQYSGQEGALGDMEVISIGIKDEETLIVHL